HDGRRRPRSCGRARYVRGGGWRNGVWQVPHAFRPKSFTMSWVSCSFFALAASRSFSDWTSRFFAARSNSGHFCQTSGLALDFSVPDPSGKRPGICWAVMANVSAFTAMPSTFPAFALAWMSAQLAPCSFMRRWRSATTSPLPVLDMPLLAQPAARPRAKPPTTIMLALRMSRPFISPPCGGPGRVQRLPVRLVKVALVDLVLDGWDRLEVLGDREAVGLGQILEARGGAPDDLRHEAARDVAVRSVPGLEIVRDLLFGPAGDAGVGFRRDVRHRGALGALALGGSGEESTVVGRHGHSPRGVALPAVAHRAGELLAARDAAGRRRGRGRLARGEGGE